MRLYICNECGAKYSLSSKDMTKLKCIECGEFAIATYQESISETSKKIHKKRESLQNKFDKKLDQINKKLEKISEKRDLAKYYFLNMRQIQPDYVSIRDYKRIQSKLRESISKFQKYQDEIEELKDEKDQLCQQFTHDLENL